MHVKNLVAQHVTDCTKFTLETKTFAQNTCIGISTPVGIGREIDGDDRKTIQIVCQIFRRIAGVKLHAKTTIAADQRFAFFLETRKRHDNVFLPRRKVGFGVNRDPFLINHAVILNDRHKAPP